MNKEQVQVLEKMKQIQETTDYVSGLLFENEGEFLQVLLFLEPNDYELLGTSFNEFSLEVKVLVHSTGRTVTGSVGLDKLTKWLVGVVE